MREHAKTLGLSLLGELLFASHLCHNQPLSRMRWNTEQDWNRQPDILQERSSLNPPIPIPGMAMKLALEFGGERGQQFILHFSCVKNSSLSSHWSAVISYGKKESLTFTSLSVWLFLVRQIVHLLLVNDSMHAWFFLFFAKPSCTTCLLQPRQWPRLP